MGPRSLRRQPLWNQSVRRRSASGSTVGATSTAPTERPTNVFATASLVFAFVFAPAGATLGHLGLRQIRRTGQRGHDRALVGVTLSYAITVTLVAALVTWLVTDARPATTTIAAPSTTAPTAAAPVPTTQAAPGPVTERDLPPFLLSLDEVKTMVLNRNLVAQPPLRWRVFRDHCYPLVGACLGGIVRVV
jgi:hypothetical protein